MPTPAANSPLYEDPGLSAPGKIEATSGLYETPSIQVHTQAPHLREVVVPSQSSAAPMVSLPVEKLPTFFHHQNKDSVNETVPDATLVDTARPARRSFPWKSVLLYAALFFLPVGGAMAINAAANSANIAGTPQQTDSLTADATLGTTPAPAYQIAQQASAINNDTTKTTQPAQNIEYELSLSAGFLRKAIQLSNSGTTQTAEDKSKIVELLNQALEAANRAIAIDPLDPRGFTSRGRVYQATSAVKPEVKALADNDFAKAKELGSTNPTQVTTSAENPLDVLPTEQAKVSQAPIIAAPNAQKEQISGTSSENANKGVAELPAGQTEVFVPFTGLQDSTQLYIKPQTTPNNATFYVKNKEAGKGFTIATTQAASGVVSIDWWEIL